jgi:hexosaminidase
MDGVFLFSASTKLVNAGELIEKELLFLDFDPAEENEAVFEEADCAGVEYKLTVEKNRIVARGKTAAARLHAAMTLKQLVFEFYVNGVSAIPCCVIEDKPKYEHRGFMMDFSRHFFGVETVKKIVDMMALAKMSVLHMHLSDNQGFRIESEKFPKLNEIGSYRAGTRGDNVPYGGYFKKSEIKDIVAYCAERGIEVVPEIDLPGHTVEILASYPELGCKGEKAEVSQYFFIDDRVICAGKQRVYEFVFELLDEVCELFPSPRFHIGGDEVPKTQWAECEDCNRLMKEQNFRDYEQLQGYFTNKVIEHLKKRGKTVVVWNEALNSGMLDPTAIAQYWNDGKKAEHVRAALEQGRKTIVSKIFAYYFDYPYGMTSLRQTYEYNPEALEVTDEAKGNIIGVEAPLWTEFVPNEENAFYKTFPRLFAVAETGWSADGKDYADFEDRLYNLLGIMQAYGLGFATVKESNPSFFKSAADAFDMLFKFVDSRAIKATLKQLAANKKMRRKMRANKES